MSVIDLVDLTTNAHKIHSMVSESISRVGPSDSVLGEMLNNISKLSDSIELLGRTACIAVGVPHSVAAPFLPVHFNASSPPIEITMKVLSCYPGATLLRLPGQESFL